MTAPIVALDTETTGLEPSDEVWEFAGIRREPDGTETQLHLFIAHDTAKCARLPEPFLSDHRRRFPIWDGPGWHPRVSLPQHAAEAIHRFLRPGRPHIVGAVPNFDTEALERLLRTWIPRWEKPWHYHLVDVETLVVGYLRGRYPFSRWAPPWDSDAVAAAVGVDLPADQRHQAMNDARWALRLYDRVMGGES